MRPATISKAGLTQPKLILDSKALGLATEARPPTIGSALPQFMCPINIVIGFAKVVDNIKSLNINITSLLENLNNFK